MPVQAAIVLPALVNVLQKALLQPSMTLAVGSCFRPLLLPLVDSVVEQALGAGHQGGASHAAISVALISLLELAPHLERFAASPSSFAGLYTQELVDCRLAVHYASYTVVP